MSEPEVVENAVKPSRPWWKKILRAFIWTCSIFIFLLGVLVLVAYIYRDDVKKYVIDEANKYVDTKIYVAPENIDVTFISSFPDVSVVFSQVSALDAVKTGKPDTLFKAQKIALAFNIMDIFHENYSIKHILVEDADVNMWVDAKGNDNFHFLKKDTSTTHDTSHAAFALNKIELKNVNCKYNDKQTGLYSDVKFKSVLFTGDFGAAKYTFGTEADLTLNSLRHGKTSYFKNKPGTLDLEVEIDNVANTFLLKRTKISIADLKLSLSGNAREAGENYLLDLALKGEEIDVASALSLLPAAYANDVADYESTGDFFIDGKISGLYGDSVSPDVNTKFGIRSGATISRKGSNVKLTDVSLQGLFSNEKGKETFRLSSFSANASKSKLHGSFEMNGFTRPEYKTQLEGNIDLGELQSILDADTIKTISGRMNLSFSGSGKPSSSTPTISDFRTFRTMGKIELQHVSMQFKGATQAIDSINGQLTFDGNNVGIREFTAETKSSDIVVNGNVKNLLGYLFTDREILSISGDLASKNLDLNKLLDDESSATAATKGDSVYHLVLPDRIKCVFNTAVRHVIFRKFEATDVAGNIEIKNKRLTADPLIFHSMDGTISGSGMIEAAENDSLLITCNAAIKDVSMYKLFYEMENFGQENDTVITYNNVRGKLTSNVNFASVWGNDLEVNERKIYTDADITIVQGELIDFKPLEVLSRFIKLDDLRHIRFPKLQNTFTIRNRVIDIPKMDINSSAINITMSGTHDFDNMVDYHFIVDMDELHAKKAKANNKKNSEFGEEIDDGGHRTRLYISMKGYIGDPDMSYDKKGAWQGIKEDVHREKEDLRQILRDEFNWHKNDSLNPKSKNKEDRKKDDKGKFILQDENAPKKGKGDEELDDSEDY